jgi:hypothetical protein
MIGYRLLPPAEEEMAEASLFYEAASAGLGEVFLDDVEEQVIGILREHPKVGWLVESELRLASLRRFPFSLIYSARIDENDWIRSRREALARRDA